MTTITKNIPTVLTIEKALEVVKVNQENDPDWTYTMVMDANGEGAVVAVIDEDGTLLGYL